MLRLYRHGANYVVPFELDHFIVVNRSEQIPTESQNTHSSVTQADAITKIRVGDKLFSTVAEGNGPVNALDKAARKALEEAFPRLARASLLNYKVRIIDADARTEAQTRVLITSTNGKSTWNTGRIN